MSRRPFAIVGAIFLVLLLVTSLVAWTMRFRAANAILDRKLAAAGVPASYRITKVGPFRERMEDVRLGDPAAPDLIARQIDVTIAYGVSGPSVRSVDVDGLRLRGAYDERGFHFGAVDRLLPQSSGQAGLPDMLVAIRDARLTLATPAGVLGASVNGAGNPAHLFQGSIALNAPSLGSEGCVARNIAVILRIVAKEGRLEGSGPAQSNTLSCPQQALMLGPIKGRIELGSDAAFRRLALKAEITGGAGRLREVMFSSLEAAVSGARSPDRDLATVKLVLNAASAPVYSRLVRRSARVAAGTPLGAIVNSAVSGAASLLDRAHATADFTIARDAGGPPAVHLHQLALAGTQGARLAVSEHAGLVWTPSGLRTDADVLLSGGGLPDAVIRLRQPGVGASLGGVATMQPYRVGPTQLAATPVRFRWNGKRADFATALAVDGPIGSGFVRGLTLPVAGYSSAEGALSLGSGCVPVAVRQLRIASITFDPARASICGRPIVARDPGGPVRLDAETGPLQLRGHVEGGAPVTLRASGLHLTQAGFMAWDLATTLGGGDQPTHVEVASLQGVFGRALGGDFTKAEGSIGAIPLAITSSGHWAMASDALRLNGNLGVSDTSKTARFNPLTTDDALLGLRHGLIEASATLREPATKTEVVKLRLKHDLSRGVGHALLDVPGITFAPRSLQPEQLTLLTLGVVANVAGRISGAGRIEWTPEGVTSSGDFATDRIDLAAAFGPVTGIKTRLHFTDLLGLVTAPGQAATIAEINPGVSVTNGVVHYQLIGSDRVRVEDAHWPFAGGNLRLDPSTLDFGAEAERQLTFRIAGLNAGAFVQQLDFPNIWATGIFDGVLPMIFDQSGGRIEGGSIVARAGGGTLAYVGELSNAQLGTMGKLAFDALKAIRYSSLDVRLDGRLDGEMVSRVRFIGVREATSDQSLVTRLIRNLPFRFNITVHAPFRGLVGSARAYIDPRLLLTQVPQPTQPTAAHPDVQAPANRDMP